MSVETDLFDAGIQLKRRLAGRTAERDRARATAVALEQQLARVAELVRWGVGRDTGDVDRLIPASELRAALNPEADQ